MMGPAGHIETFVCKFGILLSFSD